MRGSARCRGRRRGAKKLRFAPDTRWLVSTDLSLLPGAANAASLKPGRWWSCASSRLVIHDFTQTCAVLVGTIRLCVAVLLRMAVFLAVSLGCEGTLLQNALQRHAVTSTVKQLNPHSRAAMVKILSNKFSRGLSPFSLPFPSPPLVLLHLFALPRAGSSVSPFLVRGQSIVF